MIVRLKDEGTTTVQERDTLQKEMVSISKRKFVIINMLCFLFYRN